MDLSKFNLDPEVKESTGGFVLVPGGKYTVCLVNAEENPTQSGVQLILTLQIMDKGDYHGVELKDRLNIINRNHAVNQQISQGTLKRICGIHGVPWPSGNLSKAFGKQMSALVSIKKNAFQSKTTGEMLDANEIKSYSKAMTSAPAQTETPENPAPKTGW